MPRKTLEYYHSLFAQRGISSSLYSGPNGEYLPLLPNLLGRPLQHDEMDYNIELLDEVIRNYKVLNSTGGTSGLGASDVGKYLKFDEVGGKYVWTLDAASGGGSGSAGTSGTSGVDGTFLGTHGTSGTSGVDGTFLGTHGTSGTSGTDGIAGSAGTSGTSGETGTSGTSGVDGNNGTSGTSGTDGGAGSPGTSGTSGVDGSFFGSSGTSGTDGGAGSPGSPGNDGTSGTSGVDGGAGSPGTSGTSGVDGSFFGSSGTSGTDGGAGSPGSPGNDGTSGTSGVDGSFFGSSGTSGTDGGAGSPGSPGNDGTSGTSGTDGAAGNPGTPGDDGTSGTSGVGGVTTAGSNINISGSGTVADPYIVSASALASGSSGTSGISGTSGTSGVDGSFFGSSGTSGTDGAAGNPGTPGNDGTSGTSGTDGAAGTPGNDGTSGTSGTDGAAGNPGTPGNDGTSGTSGTDGAAGTPGNDGTSGTSGTDGAAGNPGTSGTSGTSGVDGTSGTSGVDGTSGTSGTNVLGPLQGIWEYNSGVTVGPTSGDPGTGKFATSSTTLPTSVGTPFYINTYAVDSTGDGKAHVLLQVKNTIDAGGPALIRLNALDDSQDITLQIVGYTTSIIGAQTHYWWETWAIDIGTGTLINDNGKEFYVSFYIGGPQGTNGTSGASGTSGTSGVDGTFFGSSGTSGTDGAAGPPGPQGPQGKPGTSGTSGTSGISTGIYLEANIDDKSSSAPNPNTIGSGELVLQPHGTITADPLGLIWGVHYLGISTDAYLDEQLSTLQPDLLLPLLDAIKSAGNSGNYAPGDVIAILSFRNVTQTANFVLYVVQTAGWSTSWNYDSAYGAYAYINGSPVSNGSSYVLTVTDGNVASGDVIQLLTYQINGAAGTSGTDGAAGPPGPSGSDDRRLAIYSEYHYNTSIHGSSVNSIAAASTWQTLEAYNNSQPALDHSLVNGIVPVINGLTNVVDSFRIDGGDVFRWYRFEYDIHFINSDDPVTRYGVRILKNAASVYETYFNNTGGGYPSSIHNEVILKCEDGDELELQVWVNSITTSVAVDQFHFRGTRYNYGVIAGSPDWQGYDISV